MRARIARANGGLAAFDEAVSAKIGGTVLTRNAGISFNPYLRKEPEMRAARPVGLTGVEMRPAPTCDAFLEAPGTTMATVQLPGIRSAPPRHCERTSFHPGTSPG